MKFIIIILISIINISILNYFFEKRIKKRKKSVVIQMGSSLKDKGGIVTVIEQITQSDLSEKYNMIVIPTYITGDKYRLFIKAIIKLIWCSLKYNIELIHIHMASKGSFYRKSIIIRISAFLKIKVILHAHGSEFEKFYNSSRNKKYINKTFNKVDKLIVLSESWKEFYAKFTEKSKIELIYNSIDIPENVNKEKREIVKGIFLGRLGKRKGIYDLIEAVEKLEKEKLKFKITLAGDGEIEEVKEVIKNKKIEEYFNVVGWIEKEEKEKLLKSSDFLILPSYNEGLPMAILEAMSRKVLVITTNVGGIPEVIKNEENGLLINPGNIEALCNSLKMAINEEEKCMSMIENAYRMVKNNFNKIEMIKKIENMYNKIICKNIKVCLASSAGGHFMQLKQLFKMADNYNCFIVTEKNTISIQLKNKYNMKFLVQQERKSIDFIFKFGINILKSLWIIIKEKPEVIISTGAGATYMLCKLTKISGGKVIFIESFAKIKSPTLTGKKVYKFADEFYVQWPEMLEFYPNARFKGGIY